MNLSVNDLEKRVTELEKALVVEKIMVYIRMALLIILFFSLK